MIAQFERFEIAMTMRQARSASHPGPCDMDVEVLVRHPKIAKQLREIGGWKIRDELRGYGAWSDVELADHEQNLRRIVWCAANNIVEER